VAVKQLRRHGQSRVYTMQEIADYFRVHYSTVSLAVRWVEAGGAPASPRAEQGP